LITPNSIQPEEIYSWQFKFIM